MSEFSFRSGRSSIRSGSSTGSTKRKKSKTKIEYVKQTDSFDSDDDISNLLAAQSSERRPSSVMHEQTVSRKNKAYQYVKAELEARARNKARQPPPTLEDMSLYVDKHRQAAVVMGERDVKTDVRLKKRRDRLIGEAAAAEEKDYETWLCQGIFEMRAGTAERALKYLNKAVEMSADDENPYIIRSGCLRRLERAEAAVSDAKAAVEICKRLDRESSRALMALGESYYQLGAFELGLVQFERGLRLRQDPAVKRGQEKCRQAIVNSLLYDISGYDEATVRHIVETSQKKKKPPKDARFEKEKERRKRQEKELKERRRLNLLLLGKLNEDVEFLQNFVGFEKTLNIVDDRGKSVFSHQKEIISTASTALDYLEKRRSFWEQTAINTK